MTSHLSPASKTSRHLGPKALVQGLFVFKMITDSKQAVIGRADDFHKLLLKIKASMKKVPAGMVFPKGAWGVWQEIYEEINGEHGDVDINCDNEYLPEVTPEFDTENDDTEEEEGDGEDNDENDDIDDDSDDSDESDDDDDDEDADDDEESETEEPRRKSRKHRRRRK